MRRRSMALLAAIAPALLAIIASAACGTIPHAPTAAGPQPESRAEPSPVSAAGHGSAVAPPRHTDPDVHFIQGMIRHHAQALVMTDLVPTRTSRPDVRLLAERIKVSQEDEIAIMRRWLEQRGETVPVPSAHALHGDSGGNHQLMPGMLSAEELARLGSARGTEFDRLFLQFMIRHHEGALVMVEQLFASPGAAQTAEVFRLASDVDADQRAEIARMRAMLNSLPAAGTTND